MNYQGIKKITAMTNKVILHCVINKCLQIRIKPTMNYTSTIAVLICNSKLLHKTVQTM